MTPKNSRNPTENRAEKYPKFDSKLGQNIENNILRNIHKSSLSACVYVREIRTQSPVFNSRTKSLILLTSNFFLNGRILFLLLPREYFCIKQAREELGKQGRRSLTKVIKKHLLHHQVHQLLTPMRARKP